MRRRPHPITAHFATWRRGSTNPNTHVQNNDTVAWTSPAAPTSWMMEVAPGETSIAPAARVASRGSVPTKSDQTVDGTPLKSVAASHAWSRSLREKRKRNPVSWTLA